jgi:hypothetical protein
MTEPADSATVLSVLRLGWVMSEYRGRSQPESGKNGVRSPEKWPAHALPLQEERSNLELAREAEQILCALGKELEFSVCSEHLGVDSCRDGQNQGNNPELMGTNQQ